MNWVGTRTLMRREVGRFLVAPMQTVLAPLLSTTVYFVVFGFTVVHQSTGDVPYDRFIVPGLVFLGAANTAFINSSTSVFFSKTLRTIEDLLIVPLGPGELLLGFVTGSIVRGLLVGLLIWTVPMVLSPALPVYPLETLFFLLLSTYVASVLGVAAGLWAEKFEQVSLFPTFFIMPLTFLGGVFYPVERLREPLRSLSELNPVVHLVRGLRHGMLGIGDGGGPASMLAWSALAAVVTLTVYAALRSGWKLKS